ncbi:YciI family protein [Sphingomonas sp. DT-51]|uniref:YciI family protein n=1 Tax=Sphingomonas sp. DT-51 TaxID=3396165 RepID=UPI003F1B8016
MSSFRAGGALSLILLTYGDIDAIDALMPAHVAWLEAGFAEGAFLVAGRREPRTGGVIVVRGDRAAAEAIAATDPFVTGGAATADVVPFHASFAADPVRAWLA